MIQVSEEEFKALIRSAYDSGYESAERLLKQNSDIFKTDIGVKLSNQLVESLTTKQKGSQL